MPWLSVIIIALCCLLAAVAIMLFLRARMRVRIDSASLRDTMGNKVSEASLSSKTAAQPKQNRVAPPANQQSVKTLPEPQYACDFRTDLPGYLEERNRFAAQLINQGYVDRPGQVFLEDLLLTSRMKGFDSQEYIDTAITMAQWLQKIWRQSAAERIYRQILEIFERKYGPGNVLTIDVQCALAETLLAQGKAIQAEPLLRDLLKVCCYSENENNLSCASCHSLLCHILYQQGRYVEALNCLLTARNTQSGLLGEKHPVYLKTNMSIASMFQYLSPGGWKENFLKLAAASKAPEPTLPASLAAVDEYREVILHGETRNEALKIYQAALPALADKPGKISRKYIEALVDMSDLLLRMYRYEEADRGLVEAMALADKLPQTDRRLHILLRKVYAEFLDAWGKYSLADEHYQDVITSTAQYFGRMDSFYGHAMLLRANMLERWGRLAQAENVYREYLDLIEARLPGQPTGPDGLEWEAPLSEKDKNLFREQWSYGWVLERLTRVLVLSNRLEEAKALCLTRLELYASLPDQEKLHRAKQDMADLSRLKDFSREDNLVWNDAQDRVRRFGLGMSCLLEPQ